MAFQVEPRELDMPIENSVLAFCGACVVKHPYEDLHPIARASGQHLELVDHRSLKEQIGLEFPGTLPDYVESGQLDADEAQWRERASVRKVRTGRVQLIVRHGPRMDFEEFLEDVGRREVNKSPSQVAEIAHQDAGFRRSTESVTHLAQVPAPTDERGTTLTCWRCDTRIRVNRERLALAVDHVLEFGGTLLVSPSGVEVEDSSRQFATKIHRRSAPRPRNRPLHGSSPE